MQDMLEKALREFGIDLPKRYIGTNRYVRWGHNNRYFAIQLQDGKGYCFGDYSIDGGKKHYVFDQSFSNEERNVAIEKAQFKWQQEELKKQKQVNLECEKDWLELEFVSTHKYLMAKKIKSHGLKQQGAELVIPMYDLHKNIHTFQYIKPSGEKKFRSGGKKKGNFYVICESDFIEAFDEENAECCICEGYATGATIYECTGIPTVVAFDVGNLITVTEILRKRYPKLQINICADNDQFSIENVGVTTAQKAASLFNCHVFIPKFSKELLHKHPTDFNDLYVLTNKAEVIKQLTKIKILEKPNEIKVEEHKEQITVPEGFKLNNKGLFCHKKKEIVKISEPIKVIATTKEAEEENAGRLIEFTDRAGKKKVTQIFDSWFTKDGAKLQEALYKNGFNMQTTTFARQALMQYLNDSKATRNIIYTKKSGWHGKAFLTANSTIGETEDEIIHTPLAEPAQVEQKGTLQEWQDSISVMCSNNSKLMLALSAAFASTILTPCKREGFFLHFFGRSSQGKTTMLDTAASIFGSHQFTRTWRMTDNGLEGIAMAYNDLCLFLDEISECDPYKVGAMAYMLVNGTGKTRATTTGAARKSYRWRLGGISTGEERLADVMKSIGKQPKAGQLMRILSIPGIAECSSYGLFEDIHGFTTAAEFSNHLKVSAEAYHGTAFKSFIEKATEDYTKLQNFSTELTKEIREKYLPQNASGQDIRAFNTFAFCAFAGELATKYGITKWDKNAPTEAAMQNYMAWLEDKGGVGNLEDLQSMAKIQAFFEKYEASRFQLIDFDGSPIYDRPPYERAGFRAYRQDGSRVFYVFPKYFDEVIASGLDAKFMKQTLKKKEILEVNSNEDRFTKRIRVRNKLMRFYVINDKIFGE